MIDSPFRPLFVEIVVHEPAVLSVLDRILQAYAADARDHRVITDHDPGDEHP